MKSKALILSLIFPAICLSAAIVLMLLSLIGTPSATRIVLGISGVLIAIFPLVSVTALRTDISPVVKWQAMFTAAAVVPMLLYIAMLQSLAPVTGTIFMVILPLALLIASGITYGKIFHGTGEKAVLRWFTAFLSTPVLWYFMSCQWLYLAISISFSQEAHSGFIG